MTKRANDNRWLNWVIAICNSIYTHPVYIFERARTLIYISTNTALDNFSLSLTHFYCIYSNCIQFNFHDQNDVFIVVCHIHFFLLPVVALAADMIIIICSQLVVCVGRSRAASSVVVALSL